MFNPRLSRKEAFRKTQVEKLVKLVKLGITNCKLPVGLYESAVASQKAPDRILAVLFMEVASSCMCVWVSLEAGFLQKSKRILHLFICVSKLSSKGEFMCVYNIYIYILPSDCQEGT